MTKNRRKTHRFARIEGGKRRFCGSEALGVLCVESDSNAAQLCANDSFHCLQDHFAGCRQTKMKGRLIEAFLLFAIVLIVAVPVLKVVLGESVRAWERQTLDRVGMNAELTWALAAVVGIMRLLRKNGHPVREYLLL
jgi:hypothetical protein